jgi:hypothetical protein
MEGWERKDGHRVGNNVSRPDIKGKSGVWGARH